MHIIFLSTNVNFSRSQCAYVDVCNCVQIVTGNLLAHGTASRLQDRLLKQKEWSNIIFLTTWMSMSEYMEVCCQAKVLQQSQCLWFFQENPTFTASSFIICSYITRTPSVDSSSVSKFENV